MNDYSINVTNRCNWKCDYCLTETHKKPLRTIESVLSDIDKINPGSSLSLCGGEPGLLSTKNMKLLFDKAREKNLLPLDVLTNGTFIKNHSTHLTDVCSIHYHCVESLKDDIIMYDVPKHIELDYTVIITESEHHLLDDFIKRHLHIEKMSLMAARNFNELNRIKFLKIVSKYKHLMTARSLKNFFNDDCNPIGFK